MPDVAEEMGSALARLAVDVVPVDTDGVEAVLVYLGYLGVVFA